MLELPDNSPQVWNRFFTENKAIVHRYIARTVKKAIQEDLEVVNLFKFKDGHITIAKKENYLYMLNQAMQLFIKEEKYEWASEVKQTINEYHINQLLKEVSNGV